MADVPLLEARHIQKRFGRVTALRDANFDLYPGEVHALLGDNGAGKSTFIKILSGVLEPSAGDILIDGKPVQLHTPEEAHEAGIETVYQDLALAGTLSPAMNLFLGREELLPPPLGWFGFLNKRAMRERTAAEMRRIKVGVKSVDQPVNSMSGGQRQAVAVARAVAWGNRVVIMDEPTAALGVRESAMVLELIREIRNHGIGVILISHDMPEVFAVADRMTVMRLGRTLHNFRTQETTIDQVVLTMTGALAVPSSAVAEAHS